MWPTLELALTLMFLKGLRFVLENYQDLQRRFESSFKLERRLREMAPPGDDRRIGRETGFPIFLPKTCYYGTFMAFLALWILSRSGLPPIPPMLRPR
jgi:hypothetical protein